MSHVKTPASLLSMVAHGERQAQEFHQFGAGGAPPLLAVEIEIGTRCNRRCSYCPTGVSPQTGLPKFMSRSVFDQAIAQLAGMNFGGRLSYHLYNEPLLRKDLSQLVASARQILPQAQQVVYTNGDLLSDSRFEELRLAGVGHFVVTRHDSDEFPERAQQTVLKRADLEITNRGGMLFESDTLSAPCFAPWEMLVIGYNGDVLLCYEDAERREIMGNILRAPISEIWSGARFSALRQLLKDGRRHDACSICRKCSNRAHVEPGSSLYAL